MKKLLTIISSLILVMSLCLVLASCDGLNTSYKVSFDTDGGTAVAAVTISQDGSLTAPETPTKAGYDFVGWFNGEKAFDFTTPITTNLTLTAKWTIVNYSAKVKRANGTEDTITYTIEDRATKLAGITLTQVDGYTYSWKEALPSELALDNTQVFEEVKAINEYSAKVKRVSGSEETITFTVEDRATKLAGITLPSNTAEYTYSWKEALPNELALNNTQVFEEVKTAVEYTAKVKRVSGTEETVTFTVEDRATKLAGITLTQTAGYTYTWKEALPSELALNNTQVFEEQRTIIEYTAKVKRVSGSEETVTFTVEDRATKLAGITLTQVDGYTYTWKEALPSELALNNTQVFEEVKTTNQYTLKVKRVSGSEETITFSVEDRATKLAGITLTQVDGYTYSWKEALPSELSLNNTQVFEEQRTAIEYTAKVKRAAGTEETITFTVEDRATKLAGITLTTNDAQYTYSWKEALPSELALNNTQVFEEQRVVNTYTITWKNADGTELEKDTQVAYGTTPSYDGTELVDFATATMLYAEPDGWDSEIASVSGDKTYTAKYKKVSIYSNNVTKQDSVYTTTTTGWACSNYMYTSLTDGKLQYGTSAIYSVKITSKGTFDGISGSEGIASIIFSAGEIMPADKVCRDIDAGTLYCGNIGYRATTYTSLIVGKGILPQSAAGGTATTYQGGSCPLLSEGSTVTLTAIYVNGTIFIYVDGTCVTYVSVTDDRFSATGGVSGKTYTFAKDAPLTFGFNVFNSTATFDFEVLKQVYGNDALNELKNNNSVYKWDEWTDCDAVNVLRGENAQYRLVKSGDTYKNLNVEYSSWGNAATAYYYLPGEASNVAVLSARIANPNLYENGCIGFTMTSSADLTNTSKSIQFYANKTSIKSAIKCDDDLTKGREYFTTSDIFTSDKPYCDLTLVLYNNIIYLYVDGVLCTGNFSSCYTAPVAIDNPNLWEGEAYAAGTAFRFGLATARCWGNIMSISNVSLKTGNDALTEICTKTLYSEAMGITSKNVTKSGNTYTTNTTGWACSNFKYTSIENGALKYGTTAVYSVKITSKGAFNGISGSEGIASIIFSAGEIMPADKVCRDIDAGTLYCGNIGYRATTYTSLIVGKGILPQSAAGGTATTYQGGSCPLLSEGGTVTLTAIYVNGTIFIYVDGTCVTYVSVTDDRFSATGSVSGKTYTFAKDAPLTFGFNVFNSTAQFDFEVLKELYNEDALNELKNNNSTYKWDEWTDCDAVNVLRGENAQFKLVKSGDIYKNQNIEYTAWSVKGTTYYYLPGEASNVAVLSARVNNPGLDGNACIGFTMTGSADLSNVSKSIQFYANKNTIKSAIKCDDSLTKGREYALGSDLFTSDKPYCDLTLVLYNDIIYLYVDGVLCTGNFSSCYTMPVAINNINLNENADDLYAAGTAFRFGLSTTQCWGNIISISNVSLKTGNDALTEISSKTLYSEAMGITSYNVTKSGNTYTTTQTGWACSNFKYTSIENGALKYGTTAVYSVKITSINAFADVTLNGIASIIFTAGETMPADNIGRGTPAGTLYCGHIGYRSTTYTSLIVGKGILPQGAYDTTHQGGSCPLLPAGGTVTLTVVYYNSVLYIYIDGVYAISYDVTDSMFTATSGTTHNTYAFAKNAPLSFGINTFNASTTFTFEVLKELYNEDAVQEIESDGKYTNQMIGLVTNNVTKTEDIYTTTSSGWASSSYKYTSIDDKGLVYGTSAIYSIKITSNGSFACQSGSEGTASIIFSAGEVMPADKVCRDIDAGTLYCGNVGFRSTNYTSLINGKGILPQSAAGGTATFGACYGACPLLNKDGTVTLTVVYVNSKLFIYVDGVYCTYIDITDDLFKAIGSTTGNTYTFAKNAPLTFGFNVFNATTTFNIEVLKQVYGNDALTELKNNNSVYKWDEWTDCDTVNLLKGENAQFRFVKSGDTYKNVAVDYVAWATASPAYYYLPGQASNVAVLSARVTNPNLYENGCLGFTMTSSTDLSDTSKSIQFYIHKNSVKSTIKCDDDFEKGREYFPGSDYFTDDKNYCDLTLILYNDMIHLYIDGVECTGNFSTGCFIMPVAISNPSLNADVDNVYAAGTAFRFGLTTTRCWANVMTFSNVSLKTGTEATQCITESYSSLLG